MNRRTEVQNARRCGVCSGPHVDLTARGVPLYGRLLALPLLRRSFSPGSRLPLPVVSELRRESIGWRCLWELRRTLPCSCASARSA